MEILPAIDLMDGGCVRLSEGDFSARTNYAVSPLDVAKSYAEQGACWLHMVDLDGAKNPQNRQLETIGKIVSSTTLRVQTGGGIRTPDDVASLLERGVSRVIVGSLAVRDTAATKAMLETFGPEKIVLALDVRNGFVTTSGWQETSDKKIEDILDIYKNTLKHVLCTDISKDGKLAGPNLELYTRLSQYAPHIAFQASGGVSNLDDIRALRLSGAAGCIVGKALYENRLTVREALAC